MVAIVMTVAIAMIMTKRKNKRDRANETFALFLYYKFFLVKVA